MYKLWGLPWGLSSPHKLLSLQGTTRTLSSKREGTHAEWTHFADLQGEHLTVKTNLFQAYVQKLPGFFMLLTGISEAVD